MVFILKYTLSVRSKYERGLKYAAGLISKVGKRSLCVYATHTYVSSEMNRDIHNVQFRVNCDFDSNCIVWMSRAVELEKELRILEFFLELDIQWNCKKRSSHSS